MFLMFSILSFGKYEHFLYVRCRKYIFRSKMRRYAGFHIHIVAILAVAFWCPTEAAIHRGFERTLNVINSCRIIVT